jgi:hypothetical protein
MVDLPDLSHLKIPLLNYVMPETKGIVPSANGLISDTGGLIAGGTSKPKTPQEQAKEATVALNEHVKVTGIQDHLPTDSTPSSLENIIRPEGADAGIKLT